MQPADLSQQRLLRAALAYADRFGWHVFPVHSITNEHCTCSGWRKCQRQGKHPRTKHGLKQATTDPKTIREWWERWPDSNIGVVAGASRFIVLDIDPRNGGDTTLAELERKHGELPHTPTALTGGGGQHYLFRRPDTTDWIGGLPLDQGVDVKADGGYIIVAPSAHVSGTAYAWDAGARPEETKLAACPQWILDGLHRGDRKTYTPGGAVTDGFLGAAFDAAGWLGRAIPPDRAAARCPWEDEHTGGSRYDSSTVVFAPSRGKRTGWFYCAHEHCRTRTLQEVLTVLPESAKAAAREQLGMAPGSEPETPPPLPAEETAERLDADSDDWMKQLRYNDKGKLTKDPGNALLILCNADDWQGCLVHDDFACRNYWSRPPPVIPGIEAPRPDEDLKDEHHVYVHHWFAKRHQAAFGKTAIMDAMDAAARQRKLHPLRDYLCSLAWDGTRRIQSWLTTYLGAAETRYTAATGRWWLISAVARAFEPGCQADHMLVLEGEQGRGKTTTARILAGDWYLETMPDIRDAKEAAQAIQGNWIVEIGELDAIKGAALTRIKTWMSTAEDMYRPSYGRFTVRRPRQCVFLGTTNDEQYFRDATGARRFWPVAVDTLDREALQLARDQLWAEAVHCYNNGWEWWPSPDLAPDIAEQQDARFEEDAWEPKIAAWAEGQRDLSGSFTVGDVLWQVFQIEPAKWDRSNQTRVGTCLKHLGYRSRQFRENGRRVRKYELCGDSWLERQRAIKFRPDGQSP